MKHYKYIGTDPFLSGVTALGQILNGQFQVQVDLLLHPWARGWHIAIKENWKEINESC